MVLYILFFKAEKTIFIWEEIKSIYLIEYLEKCLEKSITFTKGPKEGKKLNIHSKVKKKNDC